MKAEEIKLVVRDKYTAIAAQDKTQNRSSCCGSTGCCGEVDYSIFSEDYSRLEGYQAEADLGLGCGLPTEFAGIREGDHVLDLGSGAGNDCFVARTLVGETGKVTGIDFTGEMLRKARENLVKTGYKNIEFVEGDIEDMPLPGDHVDVVISNCVLNLVPDKQKAFREIYRVLKPGGHFCISDVVVSGPLPRKLQDAAEMVAGCVSGALHKQQYLEIIQKQGFLQTEVHREKEIIIPNSILLNYGIFSITVSAKK